MRNGNTQEKVLDTWNGPRALSDLYKLDLRPPSKHNLTASNFTIDAVSSLDLSAWFENQFRIFNPVNMSLHDCERSGSGGSITFRNVDSDVYGPLMRSDLPSLLSNLATGMTNYLRQIPLSSQRNARDEFGLRNILFR
ncbi:hypothetical protein BBP40_003405 [Aspergillus hancockii]|nr:hypothetical protein BBP40_003405 [Aspergillus hancockii]